MPTGTATTSGLQGKPVVGAVAASETSRVPRLHCDELVIEASLVRRLVDDAFPALRECALRPLSESGSSNALFRLGSDKLVRLPRQPGGGASIEKEARWLPFVASRVAVAVPEVIGTGDPGLGYPETWAITGWLEGGVPKPSSAGAGAGGSVALGRDLGRFLTELRAMEIPTHAETDDSLAWYRGEPLASFDADFRLAVEQCRDLAHDLDLDDALSVWDRAVAASTTAEPQRSWFHGDLLAENLLVDPSGRLAAVLDFGGLAVGDPTVDLVVAWEVLDGEGRTAFREELHVDDASWTASRGWALFIAMMTLDYYGATMPRRTADRMVLAHAAIAAE